MSPQDAGSNGFGETDARSGLPPAPPGPPGPPAPPGDSAPVDGASVEATFEADGLPLPAGPLAESLPLPADGRVEAAPVDSPAKPRRAGQGKAGSKGDAKCAGKRERILRAATKLFAERDFHRVLMDEVAHRAEVGKGTLYRYFKTKEDLFVAMLSFAVDVATERLRAKLERLDDPVEQLRFACKQALRFFRENDHLFHVLHHQKALGSDRARAELGEKRRGLRHFAEHIIAEGRERGGFEVEDAGFASTILWGMIRTALRNAPPQEPLDELAGRIVDLFTNGILKR